MHYRSLDVFSLGGWSPRIPTGFLVSRGTWDPSRVFRLSPTGLLPAVAGLSRPVRLGFGLLNDVPQPRPGLLQNGLGFSPFARRYWGNLG